MIDKIRNGSGCFDNIYDRFEKLAEQYLCEVDEANVTLFVNEAKRAVDEAFDDFVTMQEQTKIAELGGKREALLAFTDIQTGYRSLMQKWQECNPIEVQKETMNVEQLPESIPFNEREAIKRSVASLGLGSIAVLGLRFLTGSSWLYLGELAVLGLSGQQYIAGQKEDGKMLAKKREMAKKKIKIGLMTAIKNDLEAWLQCAIAESERILQTF